MYRVAAMIVVAIVLVAGINRYLVPDDLAACPAPTTSDACQSVDAVVVISGGDTDARTDEAIALYKAKWAPLLIVSGAAADKTGVSNAEAMKQRAIARGVPEGAVVAEELSETTKQNASEVKSLIEQRRLKRIALVTSGYHMRRAQLEFAAQLPNVTVLSHPVPRDKHWGPMWWATPWGWWLALGELVKIGLFAVGGSR